MTRGHEPQAGHQDGRFATSNPPAYGQCGNLRGMEIAFEGVPKPFRRR